MKQAFVKLVAGKKEEVVVNTMKSGGQQVVISLSENNNDIAIRTTGEDILLFCRLELSFFAKRLPKVS